MGTILWNLAKTFRKQIAIVLAAIAILFAGKVYISHVDSVAFDRGVTQTDEKWKGKAAEFRTDLIIAKAKNDALTLKLAEKESELKSAQESKNKVIVEKVVEYQKTPASKVKSLDDAFIDAYNQSLPETK